MAVGGVEEVDTDIVASRLFVRRHFLPCAYAAVAPHQPCRRHGMPPVTVITDALESCLESLSQ
jgi:hypothetical protein